MSLGGSEAPPPPPAALSWNGRAFHPQGGSPLHSHVHGHLAQKHTCRPSGPTCGGAWPAPRWRPTRWFRRGLWKDQGRGRSPRQVLGPGVGPASLGDVPGPPMADGAAPLADMVRAGRAEPLGPCDGQSPGRESPKDTAPAQHPKLAWGPSPAGPDLPRTPSTPRPTLARCVLPTEEACHPHTLAGCLSCAGAQLAGHLQTGDRASPMRQTENRTSAH